MWVFEETVNGRKLTDIINNDHENVKYLPGHKLPENVVRFGGRKLTKKFRFSHYILWKNQNEPFGQPHSFGSFWKLGLTEWAPRTWGRGWENCFPSLLFLSPTKFIACSVLVFLPGGSDGKMSAYNAGDLGLIPGLGRSLGEGNATHSRILAWRIPWTEEPGGLQSVGSQRAGHNWVTFTFTFMQT